MKTLNDAIRESTTLKLVLSAWVPVLLRYIFSGLDFGYGPIPVLETSVFAGSFAAITAVWLGREWRAAHYAKSD